MPARAQHALQRADRAVRQRLHHLGKPGRVVIDRIRQLLQPHPVAQVAIQPAAAHYHQVLPLGVAPVWQPCLPVSRVAPGVGGVKAWLDCFPPAVPVIKGIAHRRRDGAHKLVAQHLHAIQLLYDFLVAAIFYYHFRELADTT